MIFRVSLTILTMLFLALFIIETNDNVQKEQYESIKLYLSE